jgi:hypothetical protein
MWLADDICTCRLSFSQCETKVFLMLKKKKFLLVTHAKKAETSSCREFLLGHPVANSFAVTFCSPSEFRPHIVADALRDANRDDFSLL